MTNAEILSEIIFSASAIALCAAIALHLAWEYQRDKLNALRFRFYAVLDELQMMAVKREISERQEEYVYLRDTLLACIKEIEEVSFMVLATRVVDEAKKSESRRILDVASENPDLARLYKKTYITMLDTLFENSFILRTAFGLYRSYDVARVLFVRMAKLRIGRAILQISESAFELDRRASEELAIREDFVRELAPQP